MINAKGFITLVSIAGILFTGCGSSDDIDEINNTTVYDFSRYVVPTKSANFEFTNEERTNEDGDIIFDGEPISTEITNKIFTLKDDNITYLYKGENIKITVSDNNISWDGDIDYKSLSKRYVSIGHVKSSSSFNDLFYSGLQIISSQQCKVVEHNDFKEVEGIIYNDILVVKCESTYTESMEQTDEVTYSSNGTVYMYYSSDIGRKIYYLKEYCTNNQGDKECKQSKYWLSNITDN